MQSDAASSAADAQVAASNKATEAQLQMFHESQQNLAPFVGMGQTAMGTLASSLGLGTLSPYTTTTVNSTPATAPTVSVTPSNTAAATLNSNTPNYFQNPYPKGTAQYWLSAAQQLKATDWGRYAPATATAPAQTQQLTAQTQQTASPSGIQLPGQTFNASTGAGHQTIGGQFTNQSLNAYLAPNYAFQLAQGQKALQNSQAAENGALSGAALKGMQDYVQGTASGAYQNAFNNWMNTQNMNYSQLYNLAALGENAAATSGTNAISTGTNIGQNIIGAGNAAAAGDIASGRAVGGTLSNLGNLYLANQMSNGKGFGDLLMSTGF
jgi:hypothetical protein